MRYGWSITRIDWWSGSAAVDDRLQVASRANPLADAFETSANCPAAPSRDVDAVVRPRTRSSTRAVRRQLSKRRVVVLANQPRYATCNSGVRRQAAVDSDCGQPGRCDGADGLVRAPDVRSPEGVCHERDVEQQRRPTGHTTPRGSGRDRRLAAPRLATHRAGADVEQHLSRHELPPFGALDHSAPLDRAGAHPGSVAARRWTRGSDGACRDWVSPARRRSTRPRSR